MKNVLKVWERLDLICLFQSGGCWEQEICAWSTLNEVLWWEASASPVWDKPAISGLNFPCFEDLRGPLA